MAEQPADELRQQRRRNRDNGESTRQSLPPKLSSGDPGLDRVLGGGIPRD